MRSRPTFPSAIAGASVDSLAGRAGSLCGVCVGLLLRSDVGTADVVGEPGRDQEANGRHGEERAHRATLTALSPGLGHGRTPQRCRYWSSRLVKWLLRVSGAR